MGAPSINRRSIFLGDWAIDEDSVEKCLGEVDRNETVQEVKLIAATTVAKADTNFNTFYLKKGTTVIATLANGPNSSAGTSITDVATGGATMTLSTTLANLDLADGDLLNLTSTKTGNGLAVADLTVTIKSVLKD